MVDSKEVASLKAQVAELQNKLKDRDHMAAVLSEASREETHRAKAQETGLESRLSKLEREFDERQRQLSSTTTAMPSQKATVAKDVALAPSAELMQDVGELRGLVQETKSKLRGMGQEIAGLQASVTALRNAR